MMGGEGNAMSAVIDHERADGQSQKEGRALRHDLPTITASDLGGAMRGTGRPLCVRLRSSEIADFKEANCPGTGIYF
jgi:hypothetical protein